MHKCLSRSKDWQEGQGEIVHVAPDHTHREQERRDRCAAPATGVEVIEALVANVTATARPQLIRSQFVACSRFLIPHHEHDPIDDQS